MPLTEDTRVCGFCIGEALLQARIRLHGTVALCTICGLRRRTWTLARLGTEVDQVYREYYFPAGEFGGSYPEEIIAEMLELDEPDIGEFITEYLHSNEAGEIQDGAHPLYSPHEKYAMIELYPWDLQSTWDEFCRRIQFGQRFFDQAAKVMLDDLLAPIRSLTTLGITEPIVTLGPDSSMPPIYRARIARNLAEAKSFVRDPSVELYAPHPRNGKTGRLNPVGLPVFYGAFSRRTAIAEVRPTVGALVVTGAFKPSRDLRVLDLTAFERTWPVRSIFDSAFGDDVARWQFLCDFQKLVSQPIHPAEEAVEYIPTQAVADYIHSELGFAGIIYPSVQTNSDSWEESPSSDQNVALLRTATAAEIGGPTTRRYGGQDGRPSSTGVVRATACRSERREVRPESWTELTP